MSRKNFTNNQNRYFRITGACKRKFPVCNATGKIRYRERNDAKKVLEHAKHVRAGAAIYEDECHWGIVRAYKCEHCGGWHTTCQAEWKPKVVECEPLMEFYRVLRQSNLQKAA